MASFDNYGDETPTTGNRGAGIAPPGVDGLDWADIGKGAGGGLGRGLTGLAGTAGTIGDLTRAGLTKLGVPEGAINTGAQYAAASPFLNVFTTPSGREIQQSVENNITGKFYEPHTVAGQYTSTAAEFAPAAFLPGGGGVTSRVLNTLVPAAASETAGQATKGTAAEPYARGVAGVMGGVLGARVVTPAPPPSAARQAAVAVLDREGIPIMAGDRTGSKAVRWAEAVAGDMPFSSGAAQTLQQNSAAALDRAATRRLFDPAELQRRGLPPEAALPNPDVMRVGRQSLNDEYTRLSQNDLQARPQLFQDMHNAHTNYERLVLPSQRATGRQDLEAIRDNIVDSLVRGGGQMPGDIYQATRSRLGTQAKAVENNDPYLAGAFRDYRGALDRTMQAGLPPADAAAWQLNNQRWGNMRQIEPAVASAGENLSPAKLAQAVRSGRVGQAAQGTGDFDELARAAALVVKPLPSSGTAQRTGYQKLFDAPNMIATGLTGSGAAGLGAGPLGMIGAAAVPHLVARAVVSGPGQRYLANQVAPQSRRDLLAQILTQQGASQPSTIVRNQEDQADYARRRAETMRASGL